MASRRPSLGIPDGGRIRPEVGPLLALAAIPIFTCAFADFIGRAFLSSLMLTPGAVLGGRLWQPVTALLVELRPGTLLWACILLFWLGADLVGRWGARRFAVRWLAAGLVVNLLVVAASLPWPTAQGTVYSSVLPVAEAAVVAWAFAFPGRELRFWFVLPLVGKQVAWLMGAITVLLIPSRGLAPSLPHLLAVGGAIAWYALIAPRLRALRARRAQAVSLRRPLRIVRDDEHPEKPEEKLWN